MTWMEKDTLTFDVKSFANGNERKMKEVLEKLPGVEVDKKGNVTFSMMVQGVAVSANVTIRMVKGTNKCTATVSPNFNSNRISFTGYLYPSDQSNVFKGRAI